MVFDLAERRHEAGQAKEKGLSVPDKP